MRFSPAFLLLFVIACRAPAVRTGAPPPQDAPFVPPAGKTLLIVGQDLGSVRGYAEHVGLAPGGVTTYTTISERTPGRLHGVRDVVNYGAGDIGAQAALDAYPTSALVMGLYMVDRTGTNLARIADGTLDVTIDALGDFVREARRPIYLRIGYEFDGAWNHYEPAAYRAAFRRVVTRLRQRGVRNFAAVWHSATFGARYRALPLDAWYPGDDVVDWLGSSYFQFSAHAHEELLAFARRRAKPVMIAEAAPRGYDLAALTYSADGRTFAKKSAREIWDGWFAPFFAFVRTNADVVRAVAYINCNWNAQPRWRVEAGEGYWGDTRLEANDQIRTWWRDEVRRETWLHGTPALFGTLRAPTAAGAGPHAGRAP